MFVDESGVAFTPLVRRTWAPRGRTPVLERRLRSWKRVSLVGAWSVSPGRRRVDWCCELHPGKALRQADFVAFLRSLLRRRRGPVVLVWDRLPGHRGRRVRRVREFAARSRRLHIEYLPPYAPELNPNEFAWGYLKTHLLPQFCPHDLRQLAFEAFWQTLRLSGRERLLKSFLDATRLPFRWPP